MYINKEMGMLPQMMLGILLVNQLSYIFVDAKCCKFQYNIACNVFFSF